MPYAGAGIMTSTEGPRNLHFHRAFQVLPCALMYGNYWGSIPCLVTGSGEDFYLFICVSAHVCMHACLDMHL